jgi:hypothetical protein
MNTFAPMLVIMGLLYGIDLGSTVTDLRNRGRSGEMGLRLMTKPVQRFGLSNTEHVAGRLDLTCY